MVTMNDTLKLSLKALKNNNYYITPVVKSIKIIEPDYGINLKISRINEEEAEYHFTYRCDDRIVMDFKYVGTFLSYSFIQSIFINIKYCIDCCNEKEDDDGE